MKLGRGAWAALLIGSLVVAAPLWADEPLEALQAALRQVEQGRGVRRLTLLITQREAATRSSEPLADLRARMRTEPGGGTVSATLLTSEAGWRKEWTATPPEGAGAASARTIVVALKGT